MKEDLRATSPEEALQSATERQQKLLAQLVTAELTTDAREREIRVSSGEYVPGQTYQEACQIMDAGGYTYGIC